MHSEFIRLLHKFKNEKKKKKIMSSTSVYTVEVEGSRPATSDGGKPSAGPVYRCIYAKDGLMEIPSQYNSPWDFFRYSFVVYSISYN